MYRLSRKGIVIPLIWCLALFCAPAEAGDENSAGMIARAIELHQTRHKSPGNLPESERLLTALLRDDPENATAHCEMARVCYLVGDTLQNKEEKLHYYKNGAEHASKASELAPDSAWAHFWRAVNLGRIGQTRGVLNSLFMVSEIRQEIEKTLQLDPALANALAVRAVINYEVPRLCGGNIDKSIEDLERAIDLSPATTLFYVDLGEAYLRRKDYARARDCLTRALNIENPVSEADFVLSDRPRALSLLKKIEGKR